MSSQSDDGAGNRRSAKIIPLPLDRGATPLVNAQACPVCGRPSEVATRPFCSRRCADIDLARWLTGSYAIAGGAVDADEDGDDTAASRGAGRPPSERPHEDD